MRWISDLCGDVVYASRVLGRQKSFAAIAIGTLGLALGANTAMFGLVHGLLLAHLPVQDPERLMLLSRSSVEQPIDARFPNLFFREIAGSRDVFDGVLSRAAGAERVTIGGDAGGMAALGELVSGTYFQVLGVKPHLGRLLTPEDDVTPGAHPVVVMSYRYWQRQFGGDPSIVGSTLRFTGVPMTVVGVTPPDFAGLDPGQSADLRFPLAMLSEVRGGPGKPGVPRGPGTLADRRAADMIVVGRLRAGVSAAQAEHALSASLQRFLEPGRPVERIVLQPAAAGIGMTRRQYQASLRLMIGVTAAVLVIACLNLANLMLARGSARVREFAVRAAIGAGAGRLVRQLLAENLVLSAGGALLGLLLAAPVSTLLLRLISGNGAPIALPPDRNWTVLLFHATTAGLAVGVFGLLPALASRRSQYSALRAGTRIGGPIAARRFFLAAQVALSVAVFVGAMLFVRTVHALRATDLGMRTDGLLVLALSPQNAGRSEDQTLPFFRAVRERVAALPEVSAVSYAWIPPLANAAWRASVATAGCCDAAATTAFRNVVGPGYFATMGIPMAAGRDFGEGDNRAAPKVAIVNEAFVRAFRGGPSVLGARIGVSKPEFTIVGVARDSKYAHVREPTPPVWFVPYEQQANVKYLNLYVRTSGDMARATDNVRAAIAAVDRDVALFEVRTVTAQVDALLAVERSVATLAVSFGSIGAALAALGVYGVLAFLVTTRRREIGIRMALGAAPSAIVRQTMAEAGRALAGGALLGLAIAIVVARSARTFLYGVQPIDLPSFVSSILIVSVIVAAAAALPARRAARLDPTTALREE